MPAITEEDCVAALKHATEQLDKDDFSKPEYNELGVTPSATTIINVVGSWNEAKEKAGLEVNQNPREKYTDWRRRPNYSYHECVKAVRKVDARHEYQEMSAPLYDELRDPDDPSSGTIITKLGPFPEIREIIL